MRGARGLLLVFKVAETWVILRLRRERETEGLLKPERGEWWSNSLAVPMGQATHGWGGWTNTEPGDVMQIWVSV